MKKQLLFSCFPATLFFLTLASHAQSVQRETIASTGAYAFSEQDGILVQQTIGQPYFTGGFYSDEFSLHPGFQQSTGLMSVSPITSSFDLHLTLFPNPASGSVFIISDGIINDARLEVVDISGKIIISEKIAEFKNHKLDCQSLANGFYTISISNAKYKYSSKLIITK